MNLRTKLIQRLVHINEAIFFYPKLRRFYKDNLRSKNTSIIDVGANKGQSIDFFLKIDPQARIVAFEPNTKLFSLLQTKYAAHKNISLQNLGISNVEAELEFQENILDETSTFEPLNPDSKYLEKKAKVLGVHKKDIIVDRYKVRVIRLADYISHNKDFFDVLKIDVEGHEFACLEGLFDPGETGKLPIRFIQLESHNDDMYLNHDQHAKIEKLLETNGFVKVAQIQHGFGDFAELIYENSRL